MALTFGFYNSIEGDRVYDAIQFGRIFDGIIKDGVYATYEKGMMVIASDNPSEVIIQPGRAWFNHTWNYNDANIIMPAPNPEVLLERIDTLVLEINEELSARENSYKWVQGTPSSRPVAPALTNTSTIHQYPLCDVHRYPETTMIYTRDITNRIGTSDCPFATGVLEGIDLDAWINQWDDEFKTWENTTKSEYDTWENTTKAQFEAWMLAQESAFTIWYNAFKDQMAGDVQEVEDFVDYLESVLDASTAVHLQEEIDELKTEITSGSQIRVTTINSELYNRNVTITEPAGTVLTEKFDGSGVANFKSVPYVGNLVISSTYGQQTAERTVNTPYYARYDFAIAFWAATVNIVGDPDFAGQSVTVKDSNETVVGTVVLDSEATGVYTAIQPDTYKFILTYGGETMEVTLSVTQETTYTVTLHAPGFDYEDWLEAGGVTGSYSSLDDVLADEVALRRLFTVHASVDYMADINDDNEDVEKIINNDLAAKWINLRDYALDTLYANTYIAAYMDTADKYFYGEWALVGQVPTMTSATAPYGEAGLLGSSAATGYEAYKAFDGDASTMFHLASGLTGNIYLFYKFVDAKAIRSVNISLYNGSVYDGIIIQPCYSENGVDWTKCTESVTVNGTYNLQINLADYGSHLYWGVWMDNRGSSSANNFATYSLQFYAWQPKGNVPVMTSDTAPYGEASASSKYNATQDYFMAFDGDSSTFWMITGSGSTSGHWIQYKFTNPIKPARIYLRSNKNYIVDYIESVQGSNDGSTWEIITSRIDLTDLVADSNLTSTKYYLYLRVNLVAKTIQSGYAYLGVYDLQFYGRELSVSVPKMATNTTPYGEAIPSSVYSSDYPAWKAFDGDNTTVWNASNGSSAWIAYRFTTPICPRRVVAVLPGVAKLGTYKIQGSNDGFVNDVDDLTDVLTMSSVNIDEEITTNKTYLYLRFYQLSITGGSTSIALSSLQFYGFDYSEREFEVGITKKWLYDHGVELESFTYGGSDSSSAASSTNTGDAILISNPSTVGLSGAYTTNKVDVTSYSLLRAKQGKNCSVKAGSTIFYGEYAIGYDATTPVYTWNAMDGYSGYTSTSVANPLSPYNLNLNISSVNQSVYLIISAGDATSNSGVNIQDFVELWLE